ncbi:MAG: FG-GAP repeat protein, partial [Candidatus Kaiserbacteria bacterium]|nr:FG-GAP repeat protein [Candidatus Kaiserbacteria bacterium]
MPGTGTYRTLIVLAGVAVVFFVLYLSGFFKPNQAPDITTDLSQFDLVGQRVEEDFSQYPLVSLSEERTLTDTLKDGVEITYGNQASTTFASPDLSESLSLQFPDSLNEPLTITLPGNRQFTVRHNTTQPHRASLLTAGTNEDTVPDTLREGSMTWPSGPERSLSEVVSGAVSPQYLKYTSEDNRLHTYYAYQKDQAAGYRNLKHWTIFQTGTGHETQSYTFSNAHLTTNDRGEVEVRYLPTNTPPEPGVEEDLWARAQRTIAADMLADIENRAPDLIIPAPYTIDAQGNQQTHEWQVTKASTIDPNDTSGDYVLSVSFDVPLLGYPIALDPTLQFTAPGVSNSGDVITGEATNSEYGKAVAIGDWNSDGKTDLAVGAHDYDDGGSTDIGRVYIFWGGESTGYAADAPVIITGEVAGDLFGYSLTSGDVNGDGTDDLLVGAYNYDVSNTEGRVYIWFGGPIESGSANTADVTLTGSIAGENTGTAIGVADYNGDGVKDVAVGAYGYTSRTGRTYIFYGPVSSDVTSNADVVYTGEAGNNFFGYAITSGDLNSDGIDDLVATARAYSVTQGRAYVFYGGSMSSSSASAADVVLSGGASSMFFGNSVTIGDLNNDGTDDLAIGAIAVSSSQGAVYIFYGGMMVSESASGADVTLTGESSTNGQFGFTLAQGDLNADGSDDLVVSAPGYDVTTNEGRVYVFYGGSIISGNATSADLIITGESTSNFFGYNALAVADLNHDGKEDLVAGAYAYNSSQGRTYIFYSQSGQVNLDQHITGEGTSDYFGKSFATGDFNNDGRDDLAVGAYLDNSNAGKVYIFYNDGDYTTLASTSDVTLTGDSSSNFGGALAVGDFNSDGVDDLVVGASIKTTLTGEVYVFYGGAMVSEGASGADVTLTGEATVSFFGSSLAVGDYDADGKDDLAVGAFLYGGSKGRTYVFYGDLVSEYASTSDVLYTNDGTAEAFGYSLATGDLNSDGIDDLIVGATGYSSNLGRAYVFYGGSLASSSDSLADVILTGTIAASAFANALTIGDFNSDGRDDLVIGAPGYSSNQGRVYIFYGNILASTTDSAADVTLTGEALSSFGTALTAGDLNHDGQTDIVVGAWQYNTYQGRTYIFYNDGSYPTAAASADIIITGDSTNDDFGHAFITGDFNADGKDDLVIGAPGYNNGGDTGRIYFYETREDYAWEIQRSPLSDGLRVDPIMGYELKITGESASNLFAAASAIGDLNNDGKDDLVVGAYSYNSNAGRVYIFYNDGSYQTKAGRADVIIEGEAATNYFGVNLEIGDLNNDGKDDLVVGATLYGGTVGRAYIFYGGGIASGNATDADVVLTGEGASNSFGSALAVGDFNADGVEDLAVSANSYSSATGRAYIFY